MALSRKARLSPPLGLIEQLSLQRSRIPDAISDEMVQLIVFARRAFRFDPERHDAPALRSCKACSAGGDEGRRVADHMIGGKRKHHPVAVARVRKRSTRGGIPPRRLEYHVRFDADL